MEPWRALQLRRSSARQQRRVIDAGKGPWWCLPGLHLPRLWHPPAFQLGEMWSGPKAVDTDYVRVKAMLKALNLSVRGGAGLAGWELR